MYYKNTYKIRELQKTCSLTNISQKNYNSNCQ